MSRLLPVPKGEAASTRFSSAGSAAEKAGPMKEEEEEEEEEEALVGDAKGLSGRLSCGNDGTGDTVGGCGSDGIEVVSVLEVEDLQAHESPVL
ncbi:hypothetical protein BHE74_00049207 [Ensete ventricosum]|nr:hypothetical protein BHE74_00049207 [Ensete ventricosum]